MAKPPADADPEKFRVGGGSYHDMPITRVVVDDDQVRIDPAPMPITTLVVCNAIFVAFFFGFHWLLKNYTRGEAGPWAYYGAPIGIGLLTCVGFSAITYGMFAHALRHGPWLIHDRTTGRVTLPREGVSFERGEVIHLQYLTTKDLKIKGFVNNERFSELNLVTCRDGERKRWPLLCSGNASGAFERLLKPLIANTDLPVVRIKDQHFGWQITEQPYGK